MKRPFREHIRPIIKATLQACDGKTEAEIKAALAAAWGDANMGDRRYYPYRLWLDEIVRQRTRRNKKAARAAAAVPKDVPGQSVMFEDSEF